MTPPIDIRADHLRIVQDVLHRHLPAGVKVWVFGSRVSWMTKDSSDLDLALESDTGIAQRHLSALEGAFEDSDLPFAVDIVDLDRIGERFRHVVTRQRVRLPEWDSSRATDRCSGSVENCQDWRGMAFTEAFQVNPSIKIDRGISCAFVDMATVDPSLRSVRSSEVREFRGGGSRFQDGDTLMARITPCLENGKVARYCADGSLEPAHGSTEFIVVRGCPGITDTAFAFYMTKSSIVRDYAIGQMTGTSGRQRVPAESLEHLTVSVPSVPEQRAIAHVLGTLDDKIELNRRTNATLEAMARTLFRSWFVDFDPVRAKMEGHDTGLPKEIADLFPDRLVESELGEVPEGWPLVPLPEVIEVNPSRPLRKGMTAPYLDMANMPTRGHAPDSVIQRPFGSGMRFANGDTLVARITPCLENGKTAYVDFLRDDEIGWGSTEYIVMKPRAPLPNEFAYCLARGTRFRDFAIRNMSGTSGRQRVPATALHGFSMPFPPERVAAAFGLAAHTLFARAADALQESRSLSALRDTLLPRLVSGELRLGVHGRHTGNVSPSLPKKRVT